MYAQLIKQLQSEKAEIAAKVKELEAISGKLLQFGLETAEREVQAKIEELKTAHNFLCDQETEIRKVQSRDRNHQRKLEQLEAQEMGRMAYFYACENLSYEAKCFFKAKDLVKAWLKGYNQAVEINGAIEPPVIFYHRAA